MINFILFYFSTPPRGTSIGVTGVDVLHVYILHKISII